tara:strand:+ start:24234 stop:26081 length:1848 start_codon:yes stop_codon:yes gene_type:complete
MCGIYGSTILYTSEQIHKKMERTNFRGPDRLKFTQLKTRTGNLYLGHNRLSIIDLDERSDQPFNYHHLHIVFNGEIYNFRDIKETLLKKGYSFRTTSDTEVICAAYLEYGKNCVNHFNGMFAFVIYDEKEQKLFGALDRLAQKPFYYYLNGSEFEFSSQISSIQLFNSKLSISKKAIDDYLSWGYIPSTQSIFNEVKKLAPGHRFQFNLANDEFETEQYWDIIYTATKDKNIPYLQAKKELKDLLMDATRIRLFADVPVGVFLSGGIDSSLITALATKCTTEQVKTFSIKFNDDGFDESGYAQKVANHLQTDHHVIPCDYKEGIDLIENFSYYYDEPFADASAIPSMLLAKHTKKKVTVALSGDGADESFLGYQRYARIDRIHKHFQIPYPIRLVLSSLMKMSPITRHKAIAEILKSKNESYVYLTSVFTPKELWIEQKKDIFEIDELKYLLHNQKNIYERAGDFDLKTYLPYDINTKVDRATMAYSLEARSPFLDYRVVEMAQSLPTNLKYKLGNQKNILKDILYEDVPSTYFNRPKSGFTMPFEVWFRKELKEMVYTNLSFENLKEIPGIKPEIVQKLIKEHMDGTWNHYRMIWKLLVLQQWLSSVGNGYLIK